MTKTLKKRKGPFDSAANFKIGTKKRGNDGNMWKVVKTSKGAKRWQKVSQKKSGQKKK